MAAACSICNHPRRTQIERECLSTDRTRREIAAEYEISYRQLAYHFQRGHVREAVRAALQARPRGDRVRAGSRILNSLDDYRDRINRALDTTDRLMDLQVDEGGNVRDPGVLLAAMREQMSAIREATRLLELSGKLTGELDATKFSLYVMPQWIEIRDVLLEVLELFPEARMAILTALNQKLAARAVQALPAPTDESVEVQAEVVADG